MKRMGERLIKTENYSFVAALLKILQPVFNILFYISVFSMFLLIILRVILIGVNIPVDEMLLPPFMHKAEIDTQSFSSENLTDAEAYIITLGNGVKILTLAKNVTLQNIKSVLFAEIHVLIFILITVAPIFKFLASLLENINHKNYFTPKNARYIMFIGLCVSIGTMLIRFMLQFYNYYLLNRFLTYAPQEISLHLRIDFLSGLTGLIIILTGLVYAHICYIVTINPKNNERDMSGEYANANTNDITLI